ncbi:SAP domain-containing ribonucleoprotein [Phytophthora cinnamomi]|uniref:SAP domain-containing ribonucleoprotein n=1 Tax=Phytophthora cinnamomi TaxID=4785 RepID=UPI00355ABE63|nr:SAP domain-containing ribonucleoprotein [Phytophthora cinnamomi]
MNQRRNKRMKIHKSFNHPEGDSELLQVMSADAYWKTITLTPDVLQAALDAVSYKKNYNRVVTNKFCLYYINSTSSRVNSGLVNYLISVDGCESSQVVEGGVCDIYYCKPYKYELQLAQKAAGSYEFGVTSVCKTVDQPKSADDIRNEWSNVMPEIPAEVPAPEEEVPPPSVGEAPPECTH